MTMLDSLQNEQLKKLLRHPDMRLKDEAEIPDRLKCICCHKLLLRAMQTPCGCKICSDCFSEYIGHQNSIKCPTNQPDCQEEMLTKDNVHPDNATNKEILRLKVNCPYAGCKEVDTVQTIHSQHMDVCDRRSIKCDQCSEDIVFVDKPDHIKSKCIMRTVECPHCQKKMRSRELKERHLNVELGPAEANELCTKYVAICPNACGTKEKVNVRDHLRECPNKRTECPVTLSCDSNKMTAAKLREHMTEEAYKHFSAIDSELKQLRKDFNDANIKLNQQEKLPTETNQSWTVTGLDKQIEDSKKRVNNPTSSMNPSSLYSGDGPIKMPMLDSLQNEQLKKSLRHPDMRLEDEAEIPDRLKCMCCHKPLIKAIQSPCGCKKCSDWSEYCQQNSIKCPTNQLNFQVICGSGSKFWKVLEFIRQSIGLAFEAKRYFESFGPGGQ